LCAAVGKIEEKRKPEDFAGHRKRFIVPGNLISLFEAGNIRRGLKAKRQQVSLKTDSYTL